ncbi:MAG: hypothetical protein ACJAUH_000190 [Saprospiraceae bacterium]|jgi:hypothetical protein
MRNFDKFYIIKLDNYEWLSTWEEMVCHFN